MWITHDQFPVHSSCATVQLEHSGSIVPVPFFAVFVFFGREQRAGNAQHGKTITDFSWLNALDPDINHGSTFIGISLPEVESLLCFARLDNRVH